MLEREKVDTKVYELALLIERATTRLEQLVKDLDENSDGINSNRERVQALETEVALIKNNIQGMKADLDKLIQNDTVSTTGTLKGLTGKVALTVIMAFVGFVLAYFGIQ